MVLGGLESRYSKKQDTSLNGGFRLHVPLPIRPTIRPWVSDGRVKSGFHVRRKRNISASSIGLTSP